MDLEYRHALGELPTREEYLARHPEFAPLVELAFAENSSQVADADSVTVRGDSSVVDAQASVAYGDGELPESPPGYEILGRNRARRDGNRLPRAANQP